MDKIKNELILHSGGGRNYLKSLHHKPANEEKTSVTHGVLSFVNFFTNHWHYLATHDKTTD